MFFQRTKIYIAISYTILYNDTVFVLVLALPRKSLTKQLLKYRIYKCTRLPLHRKNIQFINYFIYTVYWTNKTDNLEVKTVEMEISQGFILPNAWQLTNLMILNYKYQTYLFDMSKFVLTLSWFLSIGCYLQINLI